MGAQLLGAAPGRVLETRHDGRVGDAEGRLALDERLHGGLVARAVRAPAPGGQQHRAAVEVEQEPVGDVETELVEHPRQHRRRVVREVPVAQGVPAAVGHDRGERVELQEQHAARRGRGGALEQARALVRGVHEPEAVDDDVGRAVVRARVLEAGGREQVEPGAAVRAAELGDGAAVSRQQPGRLDAGDGVAGLGDQRVRLGTARLLRGRRVLGELREPTRRAQPHPQGVHGVRARVVEGREVVGGRLVAEVEHDRAVGAGAPAAGEG